MLKPPETLKDIQALINDGVQEDIHLDYKASAALNPNKGDEISKDVSAFANSDGGMIIYGVEEDNKHFPTRIDGGVDHFAFSKERLEHIIRGKISPIIDGIIIKQIALSPTHSLYIVQIPKSYRGPHQAGSKRYYKRYNFESAAMEDYEITDVRNRSQLVLPLMNVEPKIKNGTAAFLVVSNIGTLPAKDVTFAFSKSVTWLEGSNNPALFANGSKYYPPGRTQYYFYHALGDLLQDRFPAEIDIKVSYIHPQNDARITDTFHINFKDYEDSIVVHSELAEQSLTIKESLKGIADVLQKLSGHVEFLKNVTGATGLDLSYPTLKNLMHLLAGDGQIERVRPDGFGHQYFQEVLGVDDVMGHQLALFFRQRPDERKELENVPGMTEELLEKMRTHFIFPGAKPYDLF